MNQSYPRIAVCKAFGVDPDVRMEWRLAEFRWRSQPIFWIVATKPRDCYANTRIVSDPQAPVEHHPGSAFPPYTSLLCEGVHAVFPAPVNAVKKEGALAQLCQVLQCLLDLYPWDIQRLVCAYALATHEQKQSSPIHLIHRILFDPLWIRLESNRSTILHGSWILK